MPGGEPAAREVAAPDLCSRIEVAAFRRGVTVAEMLRDLLSREFPPNPRGVA
jgi:hypothetical protein